MENVQLYFDQFCPFLHDNIRHLQLLQQYVYHTKRFKLIKQDHKLIIDPKHNETKYNLGDVVSIKTHPLSSAGYWIKAKFIARFDGEFKVTGKLSGNAYLVQDLQDTKAPIVTVNVQQTTLLHATDESDR